MCSRIFGDDILLIMEVNENTLIVTIQGYTKKGVTFAWLSVREKFQILLRFIAEHNDIRKVVLRGNTFGKGVFNLLRYECKDLLDGICSPYIKEVAKMKVLYLDHYILSEDRYGAEVVEGLSIEMDAPIDTYIHLAREDGESLADKISDGVARFPRDFLTDGKYIMWASKGGIPTNSIDCVVDSCTKGKYFTAFAPGDLTDAVRLLMSSVYTSQKRLSDHIDGYDVI